MPRGFPVRRLLVPLTISWLTLVGGLLWWSTAPAIVGWQPRLVTSGSMEPALSAGDIVITSAVADPEAVRPGHVIVVADSTKPGGSYLHRLMRHDPDGRLITQGDANRTPDFPPVEPTHVLGEVRFAVPFIGLPALWMHRHQVPQLLLVALASAVAIAVLFTGTGSGHGRALGGQRSAPRHRARPSFRRRYVQSRVATPLLASLALLVPLALGGLASASFASQTFSGSSLTAATLNAWLPSGVSASRASATTCLVSWTPNGSAPSGLRYDVTDGSGSTVATNVNGTSSTVTVGTGAATPTVLARYGSWLSTSSAAAAAACAGYPDAPVVTLTASDAQLVATWPAPGANGSAVTGYTATISPGGTSCSLAAATRTCTFSGLTNGTSYTVSVTATNAIGTSTAGTATGFSYPSGVMTGGSTSLWLDGADRSTLVASSACTGATATTTIGCWKDKSSNADNAVQSTGSIQPTLSSLNSLSAPTFDGVDDTLVLNVAKLPTGTAASTIYVVAVQEDPSPTTAQQRSALAWGATSNAGTRAVLKGWHSSVAFIDTYNSAASPTRSWATGSATLVDGEVTGTTVTTNVNSLSSFSLSEAHSTGTTGAWVGAEVYGNWALWQGRIAEIIVLSSTVTSAQNRLVEDYLALKWGTAITPQAPTAVTGTSANASVAVSWAAPGWNGGSAVTSYTATATPSGQTCTATAPATTCTITGLANGTAYTFTVTATNAIGTGPASAASASVTPATVPGAPTSPAAVAGDTTTAVSWTAPASNGGAAVSSYTATAVPSDGTLPTLTCTSAASPCTVTGLTDGITYTFTVKATNSAGSSAASSSVTTMPYPALLTSANSQIWLDGYDIDGNGVNAGSAENCDTATSCASLSNVAKRWVDKSGRGHDAVQATTALAGTYDSTNHTVSFNANGYFQAASVGVGPDATVFTVAASTVTPFNTNGWLVGSRSANGYILHPGTTGTGVWWFGITSAGYNVQTSNAGPVSPVTAITNAHLWDGWISGTGTITANMGTDGNIGTTRTDSAARVAASVTLTIGADDYDLSGRRGKGAYREVTAFNRALTAAERRTMQEYLARKWGLAITPSAPVSPGAVAGTSTATVSWTVPAWNGGAAISAYTVTPSGAGSCTWSSGTTASCTGLTHSAAYTFTVQATNSLGTGPTSTTGTVTP